MHAHHGLEPGVFLARGNLSGEQPRQVVGAARTPAREPLHLHLDVEETPRRVTREYVELDGLAGELFGEDAGVEHLELEDVIVLRVEQFHAGRL